MQQGTQGVNHVDKMVRAVAVADAQERYEYIWREVNAVILTQGVIQRPLYHDALLKSARLIMAKLEEKGDFTEEVWGTYRQFIGHCVLSYGTAEVPKLLRLYEGIAKSVLKFPSYPVCLINDYRNCIAGQREQYQLAYIKQQGKKPPLESTVDTTATASVAPAASKAGGKKPVDGTGGLGQSAMPPIPVIDIPQPKRPDIEYSGALNAAAPTIPQSELMKLLNDIPTRMCLVHTNSILHMKLTNPLAVPSCSYVTTGYGCDTCRLQGLHVAYQAMLYDTDEEEENASKAIAPSGAGGSVNGMSNSRSGSSNGDVRSDAQISKKRFHGFDVCSACAVFFFLEQKKYLSRCLKPPYQGFALGHASGITIGEANFKPGKPRHHKHTDSNVSFENSEDYWPRETSVVSLPQTPPSTHVSATDRDRDRSGPNGRATGGQQTDPLTAGGSASEQHSRSSSQVPAPPPLHHHQHSGSYPTVTSVPRVAAAPASVSCSPNELAKSMPPPPPARPPQWHLNLVATQGSNPNSHDRGRRRSSISSSSSFGSGQSAPLPPKTRAPKRTDGIGSPLPSRCSTPSVLPPGSIQLSVTVAPYGARPIAWVLPEAPREVSTSASPPALCELDALLPPKDWKSRCSVTSLMAYKRQSPGRNTGNRSKSDPSVSSTSSRQKDSGRAWQHAGHSSPYREEDDDDDDADAPPPLLATVAPNSGGAANQLVLTDSSDVEFVEGDDDDFIFHEMTPNNSPSAPRKKAANKEDDSVDNVMDACAICLSSLAGDTPVIETKCHHFFHVECIEGFVRMHEETCPLCRSPHALPDLSRDTALKQNVFHLTLQLTEAESARESVTVCVAALVTRRGTFENIMSVSAAQCVKVAVPQSPKPTAVKERAATQTTSTPSREDGAASHNHVAVIVKPAPEKCVPTTGGIVVKSHPRPAMKPKDKDPRMRAVRESSNNTNANLTLSCNLSNNGASCSGTTNSTLGNSTLRGTSNESSVMNASTDRTSSVGGASPSSAG